MIRNNKIKRRLFIIYKIKSLHYQIVLRLKMKVEAND